MKVYARAPTAARHYVEADRGRADDYYLGEGTGVARRFTTTDGRVTELAPLTSDSYEAWVAGRDPDTGEPRGRLRGDAHAVRFVEVVVNGPKTWSLAAALHPDIAAAYDAAQDRAAEQIIAWLSEHATTRVGPPAGRCRCPWKYSRRPRCGTTRPGPATHTGICTSSCSPGCSPPGNGGACIPSASATSSTRSTGSGTPRWTPTQN